MDDYPPPGPADDGARDGDAPSDNEVPADEDTDTGTHGGSDDPFHLSAEAVDAAFAGIAAELGPTGLSPEAIVPGPEGDTTQAGPRDYAVADVEEGYVPPDPEPLDTSDTFLVSGWVGLGGGLAALVLLVIFWPGVPRTVLTVAALVAIAGAAMLTWRMPRHGRHDDHDNGAVV